ncbi:MAG: 3-isopropylmalate dehydrogenase [Dehalococcoidia bacterium]|jgi:3-isopropylmalate dehydrogenase|nr:3-isopropylmalate dehydrogenase [Dehalococcoidia bacterium]
MSYTIAVLGGDGIGPEVTAEGRKVLLAVGERYEHDFQFTDGLAGGAALDASGNPLSDETLAMCQGSDAVLLGAVGGPKWDNAGTDVRPEQALFRLRKGLNAFANLRPVKSYPMLTDKSPLRPDVVKGADIMFVRELTGGMYFGQPKKRWETPEGRRAVDTEDYSEHEIARVVRVACELARQRRKHVTSVDKFNALISSRLWRQVATEIAAEYPDVTVSHMLADTFSMQLIMRPTQFDVVVTTNMFGDIFTDEAAVLSGSMGMLPSASLAGLPTGKTLGLYEPIHGSAPDIAGKGIANPLATILSCAMLLRYSLGLDKEATAVEAAVLSVLEAGHRTADIASGTSQPVSTSKMGDLVAGRIRSSKG